MAAYSFAPKILSAAALAFAAADLCCFGVGVGWLSSGEGNAAAVSAALKRATASRLVFQAVPTRTASSRISSPFAARRPFVAHLKTVLLLACELFLWPGVFSAIALKE